MLCISPLPRTMYPYVTTLNPSIPLCSYLPPAKSHHLVYAVVLTNVFQPASTLFGPVTLQMKHVSQRLSSPRRRPGFLPSSPRKTTTFMRLQAQLTMTLRAGKRCPRPSRRRVMGALPVRLRPFPIGSLGT